MRWVLGFVLIIAAQVAVAANHQDGVDVYERRDSETALGVFKELALQGDAAAQFNLGGMRANGEGVLEGRVRAYAWFNLAVSKGGEMAKKSREVIRPGMTPADIADAQMPSRPLPFSIARGESASSPPSSPPAAAVPRPTGPSRDTVSGQLARLVVDAEFQPGDMSRRAHNAMEKARRWLDFVKAYGLWYAERSQDPEGWETLHEDSVAKLRELQADALDGIDDPALRAEIVGEISEYALRAELQAQQDSHTQLVDRNTRPPTPPAAAAPRPAGPSRDIVREAQTYLALLGYDPGPADGLLGKRTAGAVREFERDLEMTPTGQISEALVRLLQVAAIAAATSEQERPAEVGPAGSGTGFFVSSTGALVTNHHVVEKCGRLTVKHRGAEHDVVVRSKDAGNDLALLDAASTSGETASFSESPRARLGEEVTVAGYPLQGLLSAGLNVTTGTVSALAGPGEDARLLQITAPVQAGNSGGPLLDKAGNVVGVVVGKLDAIGTAKLTGDIPQNVNFAIKGAVVRSFLDIHGVDYERRSSNEELAPEAVAARAREFTVAVQCWE